MELNPQFKKEILEHLPNLNITKVKVTMHNDQYHCSEIIFYLEDGRQLSIYSTMPEPDDSALEVELY